MPTEQDGLGDSLARVIMALGRGAAWLFVVGAAITVYEVVMRYVFDAPTTWVHVTTTTLCAIGFAFGGAYAMVRNEHVRITSVLSRLPLRMRWASEILAATCGVFYLAGLAYALILQAVESTWHFEGTRWVPEPVPGPPHWPLPALTRVAMAIGAVLFLFAVVRQLVKLLRARDA
jgi:TRAP-type C4-dicarboxylate transport system permease small subunit